MNRRPDCGLLTVPQPQWYKCSPASHREVSQPPHKLSASNPVDEHQLLILFLSEAHHLAHNVRTPTEHPPEMAAHTETHNYKERKIEGRKKKSVRLECVVAAPQLKTMTVAQDDAGEPQFLSLMMQTPFSAGGCW